MWGRWTHFTMQFRKWSNKEFWKGLFVSASVYDLQDVLMKCKIIWCLINRIMMGYIFINFRTQLSSHSYVPGSFKVKWAIVRLQTNKKWLETTELLECCLTVFTLWTSFPLLSFFPFFLFSFWCFFLLCFITTNKYVQYLQSIKFNGQHEGSFHSPQIL